MATYQKQHGEPHGLGSWSRTRWLVVGAVVAAIVVAVVLIVVYAGGGSGGGAGGY
jgi:ABC-type microcin C transport system permease subunit YejB